MKIFFYLTLLFGFCYCVEDSTASENCLCECGRAHQDVKNYDISDRGYHGNPIVRPCAVHDTNCIRRVFADNSRCTPTKEQIPEPFEMQQQILYIPHANLTFFMNNTQYRGLREWKIKEFYLNKATDKLVLEVVFDRIVLSSPNATLRFYRKGKEPIETTDYAIIEYFNVSLTLTIPNIKNIQLYKGHVYSYLPDSAPLYSMGSSVYSSTDTEVTLDIEELTSKVGISIREAFLTQGPIIMSEFLKSTICDFGKESTI